MEMRYAEELTDAKVEAKKVQIGDILPHAIEFFTVDMNRRKMQRDAIITILLH